VLKEHCPKSIAEQVFVNQYLIDQIPLFRFDSLPANGVMEHAVFSRQAGVSPAPFMSLNLSISVSDNEANVFANRARAYATHGRTNGTLVHAYLTHGSKVAQVASSHNGQYVGPVDGLVTNEPNCGLTMNYADCSPILLYDPARRAIGLGHAGWKGAVKDLPGALVRAMQHTYGTDPADIVAGVGPCIGPCCYEVGVQVISAVTDSFEHSETLLHDSQAPDHNTSVETKRHFDLPEANRRRLSAAGVENVEMSGLCTACRTDLFFSHRAEKGRTGRFGTILLLTG